METPAPEPDNAPYHVTYYQKNREQMIANAKRFRTLYPERVKAAQQSYYQRVLKSRRALERKLRQIDEGRYPPKPKEPKPEKPKRTRRFISEAKTVTKQKKVFPDLVTIAPITVAPPSSGKIEMRPGIVIDWNNL